MDLLDGIHPLSLLSLYPNTYGRGVVAILSHISITTSELSITPVGMRAFPGGYSRNAAISSAVDFAMWSV